MSKTKNSMDDFLSFLSALTEIQGCDKPRKGSHRHRCPCGHIWSHGNDCSENPDLTNEEFNRAHSCPKCDKKVNEKYYGDDPTNSDQGSCCVKKTI